MGPNLGVPNVRVHWCGIGGLEWHGVYDLVVKSVRGYQGEGVLIIHAGGNDLGRIGKVQLVPLIRADLQKLHELYPNLVIVWSDIVSRLWWKWARSWEAVERARKSVNIRVSRVVKFLGGVLRHTILERSDANYWLPDKVHLNDVGTDILLSDFQDGLELAIAALDGRRSK